MSPRKKVTKTRIDKKAMPKQVEHPEVTQETFRCTCCGYKYKKQETNFFASKSPIFKGNNGYFSLCKRCVDDLYKQYTEFFGNDEERAAERMCQLLDMYWDVNAWAASRKGASTGRSRIGVYISKLNLSANARGGTYSDSLVRAQEAEIENAESIEEVVENKDIDTPEETVRRFGLGFTAMDYDTMQYCYDDWICKLGPPEDKRQEELYIMMCYLKLNLQKSLQENSTGVGSLANSYKAFIEAATTEIEDRKKKSEAEIELKPLGVLIKDIEQYCPAEYYKNKKLYADYDKLKEYITRFMVRPLRNLLTGSNDMDAEYKLSDSEE